MLKRSGVQVLLRLEALSNEVIGHAQTVSHDDIFYGNHVTMWMSIIYILYTRIVIKTILNILCKTIPLWCAIFSDDYDVVYTHSDVLVLLLRKCIFYINSCPCSHGTLASCRGFLLWLLIVASSYGFLLWFLTESSSVWQLGEFLGVGSCCGLLLWLPIMAS